MSDINTTATTNIIDEQTGRASRLSFRVATKAKFVALAVAGAFALSVVGGVSAVEPTADDTDGDGLKDGLEVKHTDTDPRLEDTDGDGLSDGLEVNRYGTDPNEWDSDHDGASDRQEVDDLGIDPNNIDSDGDRIGDYWEVLWGMDPLDPRLR